MRVVMLSTNMARGGAETQVARLAIALKLRGWDVHVISLIRPTAFVDEFAEADVPLHPLWRLPALRPQILHCHMFHANVLGRVLRLLLPFPVVISTLHSIAESSRRSGRIFLRDVLYNVTDPLADATVSVSTAVAERHGHTLVIPNGVDTRMFHPAPRERNARFTWIAAGRLMWKKNYPALLRAMRELPQARLLIAGTGPDEAKLRASAPPNVEFLGARTDIHALMNSADAFVLSSVVEGLPLVLLEAAACGLPCVATGVGGVRETGIGVVTDAEGLAASMRQVMNMSDGERAALGEAGRRIVLERYSMDAVVQQWEDLYRTLTASM